MNEKFYIGVHKTNKTTDNYLGSGKILKRAIEKYGVENFKRIILFETENREEAYAKEKELVEISTNSYNLKSGGEGGFDFINKNKLQVPNLKNDGSVKHIERCQKGGKNSRVWETSGKNTEKRLKQRMKNIQKINFNKRNGMSQEQKRKISESMKKFYAKQRIGDEIDSTT